MYFLFTNDVELTSLELNRPAPFMAERVKKIGMPRVIDLCAKYDIQSTFFFTADIAQMEPSLIDTVKAQGHEIGCHGLTHDDEYDLMPLQEQIRRLKKAKHIIESIANQKIVSFRSPEARINNNTINALEQTGFKYDSSVCPQRFDGPLSKGFKKKILWMIAPRRPYTISKKSFINEGKSKILEIPISAYIFPFVGSTMRVSPKIFSWVKRRIINKGQSNIPPAVFVFHPTECIEIDPNRIEKQLVSGNFFSGVIRKKMKWNNLGLPVIKMLENLFKEFRKLNVQYSSVANYALKYNSNKL